VRTDANGNALRDDRGNLVTIGTLSPEVTAAVTLANTRNADAKSLNDTFGAGSPARILATAFSGAAGSNVAGSLGGLAQSAVVNGLQSLAVTEVKGLADSLFDKDGKPTAQSETVRAALQGIVGCSGAAAGGSGDCTSAAVGAAGSVAVNLLLSQAGAPVAKDTNGNGRIDPSEQVSIEDQQARTNLIATFIGTITAGAGLDASSAATAAQIETENNANSPSGNIPSAGPGGLPWDQWKKEYAEVYNKEFALYRIAHPEATEAQIDTAMENYAYASDREVSLAGGPDKLKQYLLTPGNDIFTFRAVKSQFDKLGGAVAINDLIGLESIYGKAGMDAYLASFKTPADAKAAIASIRAEGLDAAQRFGFNNETLIYYAQNRDEIDARLPADKANGMKAVLKMVQFETGANPNPGFFATLGLAYDSLRASVNNKTLFSENTAKSSANVVPNAVNNIAGMLATVKCVGSSVMSGCEEQAIADAPKLPTFEVKCDSILLATQCTGGEIIGVTVSAFAEIGITSRLGPGKLAPKAAEPAPILGKGQATGGTTHAATSERHAVEAAAKTGVDSVHLNRPLSAITKGETKSGLKPDVCTVNCDGSLMVKEVVSPSNVKQYGSEANYQAAREKQLQAAIPTRPVKVDVVDPDPVGGLPVTPPSTLPVGSVTAPVFAGSVSPVVAPPTMTAKPVMPPIKPTITVAPPPAPQPEEKPKG
jgi:hypothetical protein